jgi:hypothetical protein
LAWKLEAGSTCAMAMAKWRNGGFRFRLSGHSPNKNEDLA